MGKRLGLRPLQSDDAQFLYKWHNDSRVLRRYRPYQDRFCVSMEDENSIVVEMIKQMDAKHFVVVEIKGNEPVGLASLSNIDQRNAVCEIQVLIGEVDRWELGYCKDSVSLLVEYAFRVLNLHRIYAKVSELKEDVIKCFDECGFNLEGRLRQDHFSEKEWRDTLVMSILAHEFGGD